MAQVYLFQWTDLQFPCLCIESVKRVHCACVPKCPCGVLYAVLGFCPKDLSSRKRTKFLAAMFANIINDSHHDVQFIYIRKVNF